MERKHLNGLTGSDYKNVRAYINARMKTGFTDCGKFFLMRKRISQIQESDGQWPRPMALTNAFLHIKNKSTDDVQASSSMDEWIMIAGSGLLFLPFEYATAILAVVVLIAACKGKLISSIARQPGAFWIYTFASLQMLSSLASGNGMGVLNSAGTFIIAMSVALICPILNPRTLKIGMQATGVLSCLAALGGFAEFSHLVSIHQMSLLDGLMQMPEFARIRLTFYNPNLYAAMAVFFLAICLYLFLDTKKAEGKLFWAGASILNLCALYLTGSRMALAPAVLFVPVYLFFKKSKKPFWISIVLLGVLGVLVLLFPHLIPRLGEMKSVDARIGIWQGAIEGISQNWLFGGGPQYYDMIWRQLMTPPAPHAHNLILDLLLNSGLVGTLVICVYASNVFKAAWDMKGNADLPYYRPLVLCLTGAVLIEGIADCTVNFPAPALVLLTVMSLPVYQSQEQSAPAFTAVSVPVRPVYTAPISASASRYTYSKTLPAVSQPVQVVSPSSPVKPYPYSSIRTGPPGS